MSIQMPLRVLRNSRNARLIWTGETISYFGDAFYDIAIMWYIYSITSSGLKSGFVIACSFLPNALFGSFCGTLADRFDRRKLMILVSIMQAVLVAVIGVLIAFHWFHIWQAYFLAALLSLAQSVYSPSFQSLIPELVATGELPTIYSLFSTSRQLAHLIGTACGGIVIARFGLLPTIGFEVVTFLATATTTALTNIRSTNTFQKSKNTGFFRMTLEGFTWLIHQKVLLVAVILGAFVNIALAPGNVLPPMLIKTTLHASPTALGVFNGCAAIGVLFGGLFISMKGIKRIGNYFILGLLLQAVGLAVVAFSTRLLLSFAGNFVIGLGIILSGLTLGTMLQVLTPRELRGRVQGVSMTVATVGMPVAYIASGALADSKGTMICFLIGSIITIGCLAVALVVRNLRQVSVE